MWSIALLPAACSSCSERLVGYESGVAIMLDFSKTFAPYSEVDEMAVKEIGKSIIGAVRQGWLQQPVKIEWAAFGDQGLIPVLPCGPPIVFAQKLTGGRRATPEARLSTNIEDLASSFEQCAKAVKALSVSAQQYPDVSGALAFAEKAVAEAKMRKVIIVYSDLREDLPAGRAPSTYDLSGNNVFLIWRPGLDDRDQPTDTQQRIREAVRLFQERGSVRVCDAPVQVVTSGDILGCLTK